MGKERGQVAEKDRWNVEALYPSLEEWTKDFNSMKEGSTLWKQLISYKGKLQDGPGEIGQFLKIYFNLDRLLNKLYTYAALRHHEDMAHDGHKQCYLQVTQLMHAFLQQVAWMEPELLQIPSEKMSRFLKDGQLAQYKIYLEKIVRFKPHTLSIAEEELLAKAGQALETAGQVYTVFSNADLKFPSVQDEKGKNLELTTGKYANYIRSSDRVLRKNAFQTIHRGFEAYENTLCELIHGQVQRDLFFAKSRKFSSCLEAALFPHQVDVGVYMNLIKTVRANLSILHSYLALRKQLLGVEELHLYDVYAPFVPEVDLSLPYEQAEEFVIASVAPLGKEYQQTLKRGLLEEKWVDRYENERKRSGAYSGGCYDSMPYILMNYDGQFQDMKTLAHEAGHSMHSWLSCKNQPYHYSNYPIFVAEVASTFNEELLSRYLMEKERDHKKKIYLIFQKLEDLRGTLFRQTLFAEFELKIHTLVEQQSPLTPTILKEEYRKLNEAYFGKDVVIDKEIEIEWARIPHFYSGFYVYQYATGISAAHALVETVFQNGPEKYLTFLSSGSSQFPIELLKQAGVDMHKPHAVEALLRHFEQLVKELKKLLL